MLRKRRVFNILLLGQTGTGKSTFINSMANYFTYSNFKEALQVNEPICLLPAQFSITLSTMEDIVVKLQGYNRGDTNERHNTPASSCTLEPRVYEFLSDEIEYHVMDVPGIGDVDGTEQDSRNKAAILRKLKEFKVLHGIFILLNSVGPRLTPEIKSCYNEILMELHRNATPNIMFVVTNSRSANYLPGTAMTPLKTYVEELAEKGIRLNLDRKTVFCLDNEGFRYQCGYKNDRFRREFSNRENNFEESWMRSRKVVFEMFHAMLNIPEHRVAETISISEARIIIQALMGPLAKVYTMIENEMSAGMKKTQIESLMETGNIIKKETIIEKLETPQCVCLNCATRVPIPGTREIQLQFSQICHNKCRLSDTFPDKFPEPKLRECAAFDVQGNCIRCKCPWSAHLRVTEKTFQKLAGQPRHSILTRQQAEQAYSNLLKTLRNEQTIIWSTIIKLAQFLKSYAIVDFNPVFEEKLKTEIQKQEMTRANIDVIQNLKQRLEQFNTQLAMVQTALQKASLRETEHTDVNEIMSKLFGLQIYGKIIKNLYESECTKAGANPYSRNIRYEMIHSPLRHS